MTAKEFDLTVGGIREGARRNEFCFLYITDDLYAQELPDSRYAYLAVFCIALAFHKNLFARGGFNQQQIVSTIARLLCHANLVSDAFIYVRNQCLEPGRRKSVDVVEFIPEVRSQFVERYCCIVDGKIP